MQLDGLDAFLKACGVGWVKRKAAAALIKRQRHEVRFPEPGRCYIKVQGKMNGDDEKTLNLGKPTTVVSKDENGVDTELTLHLRWDESRTRVLNDLETAHGPMHVERWVEGAQMVVECTHVTSGVKLRRLFDRTGA